MKNLSRRSLLTLGAASLTGAGAVFLFKPDPVVTDPAYTLTPPEALASAASGGILLIDIRRPDEWQRTGIGMHATPIDMRDDDFIPQLHAARLSPEQPVALICARGVRSARLTKTLIEAGIGPILDVPEGMLGSSLGPGWLERELPVTTYTKT